MARILVHRPFLPSLKHRASALDNHAPHRVPPAISICSDAATSCAKIVEDQMQGTWTDDPCLISAAHIGAAVLMAEVWVLKARERTHRGTRSADIKPAMAHTVQSMMSDVAHFVHVLEWAAPRWKTAAFYLSVALTHLMLSNPFDMCQCSQTVRASLPDSHENLFDTDEGFSEYRQHQHVFPYDHFDDKIAGMPESQDVYGWQWYSTAQVPSNSSPSYTAVSDPYAMDIYSSHPLKQEPEDVSPYNPQQNHRLPPDPFPVQAHLSSVLSPSQPCSIAARNTYGLSSSLLPRASTAGREDRPSTSARGVYDISMPNDPSMDLHPVVYDNPKSATHTRKASFAHEGNDRVWREHGNA
jgi:hypothetical protein